MAKTYENDTLARRIIRITIFIELGLFILGGVLAITLRIYLGLLIWISSLLFLLAVLIWLYLRFNSFQIVKERNDVLSRKKKISDLIIAQDRKITETTQNTKKLKRSEQSEIDTHLKQIQDAYIHQGLKSHSIDEAKIPGVGPKNKEKLLTYRIRSAADVDSKILSIQSLGKAKAQAVLDWRNRVNTELNITKPQRIPEEQELLIHQKYEKLQEENFAAGQSYLEEKNKLEQELLALQPELLKYQSISPKSYFNHSLGKGGRVAVLAVILIVGIQLIMGFCTSVGTIVESIPTPTETPTLTPTPTYTYTSTITLTPTITLTSTITFTPTITSTPTITLTPTSTKKPTSTASLTLLPNVNVFPTQGSSGQTCCKHCGSDSQPCGNSCISLNKTCHQPPGCACP
jgi:hypothetical protein